MDKFLDYGLWLTMNDLAEPFVRGMQNGALNFKGKPAQAAFALRSLEPARASQLIGQLVQQRKLPANGDSPLIELIGEAGGPGELSTLFKQLRADGFETQVHAACSWLCRVQRIFAMPVRLVIFPAWAII